MTLVNIIGKSRQGDGTMHITATARAGTSLHDVVEAVMKQLHLHHEAEGWGEIKDESQPEIWTYILSITP